MDRGSVKLLAALALVAAFVAAAAARYRPPPPRPGDAPPRQFSAVRARELLREVLGDGQPHPAGSAAAASVRQRIAAGLERLGIRPEVQEGFACGAVRICGRVENLVARIEGTRPGKAVLLSVHYDSVPAGPGASDDGAGVAAALEIARALKADPAPPHPVVFLFNEGEEDDLLGAQAFLAGHPWAKEIGAVVNLEARGTSGASLMFETSDESGWLVDLFARSVARPASNSIYYTVYKLLPNDTDLTVYKRAGLSGLNFAFIGGEARYHTPRDDFAHADPGSLQHHGDNALAMMRALAHADLDSPRRGELVFFDLLALRVMRWPLRSMPALAVAAALLWLAGAAGALRRGELRPLGVAWGAGAFLLGAAATWALGWVLLAVLRAAGAVAYPFVAHPAAARAAFLALPLLGSWLAAVSLGRRAGAAGLWWGTWAGWAVAGLATSFASPGLSYPFVLPCLVAGLCGLAAAAHARWLPLLLPLGVAAVLWCPVAWLLYDALGIPILPASSALLALVLGAAAPAWLGADARLRGAVAFGTAAVAVTLAVAAAVLPPFSADNPRKLNLWYRLDAESQQARWLASAGMGPLPVQLAAAAPFERKPAPALEWAPRLQAYAAPAGAIPMAKPELVVAENQLAGATRKIRARLRSPRGAPVAGVVLPVARVVSVRMNGVAVPGTVSKNLVGAPHGDTREWRGYACATLGPSGVELELELNGPDPVDAYLWDASPGLPEQGAALLSARPAWVVPFQTGDRTLVVAKLRL
ncbi:MAG TPA: M20/M25/M40 family metallo-hydrolase [Myxococcales bacterium]|nr:M20/M25/M40 family metallo-hydrolase [Myxococcales bacterium]